MSIQTVYDTHEPQPCAVVLHVELPDGDDEGASSQLREPEAKLEEAVNLTEALNLDVIYKNIITLRNIHPKTLIGKGKLEEVEQVLDDAERVDVVIVNTQLSPRQQKNLEETLQAKVIDRTHLILEIFADRAQTKAGRLQVELAHQTYLAGRLVRAWTHLERQRGGMGKTGGPGERQIELDKRMINDRIVQIKRQLQDVKKERDLQRRAREKNALPVVSLVGYTNAGKSTLFNALVSDDRQTETEDAFVKDMLFATLDPLMRKIKLDSGREVLLSDTVGFVSNLPHELVEAFSSTLEEVTLSDLILHVHDASNEDAAAQNADVVDVLKQIKADKIPVLHVANKADLVQDSMAGFLSDATLISALSGQGIHRLKKQIEDALSQGEKDVEITLDAAEGRKLSWLHANGQILKQELDGQTWHLTVRLKPEDAMKFQAL